MAEPVKTITSVKVGHVMIMQFAQIQKEVSTANVKMVILKMDLSVLKLMNVLTLLKCLKFLSDL